MLFELTIARASNEPISGMRSKDSQVAFPVAVIIPIARGLVKHRPMRVAVDSSKCIYAEPFIMALRHGPDHEAVSCAVAVMIASYCAVARISPRT